MQIDKLIIAKRVPIFAVNPTVYVVCMNEDKDENIVFQVRNEEAAKQIIQIYNEHKEKELQK